MQLVAAKGRRRAALQVRHRCALLGHDQRALELPRLLGVDAEVGRQIHRAFHALGDEAKRAIGEHCRVERGKVVVAGGNHRSEVLLHQFGVLQHGLRHGAEDDTDLGQLGLVGGSHRHAVKDHVHRHAGQRHALVQGHAKFLEGAQQLGIHLVHAAELGFLFGGRVVADGLKIDLRIVHVGPRRLGHQ